MNSHCKLICSFYEIYNNQVYDLTQTGKRFDVRIPVELGRPSTELFRLFVREDGEHHVNVIGVTETVLRNLETLRAVIDEGLVRRHHGKSAFNANSSRSHAVFQITCKDYHQKADTFR